MDDRADQRLRGMSGNRAKGVAEAGFDEGFYTEAANRRTSAALRRAGAAAAEFAERFAVDHEAMDDELWGWLRSASRDDDLADLTMCCGTFLGLGRALAVIGHERR